MTNTTTSPSKLSTNLICQLSGQIRDILRVDRYVQSDNAVYFFARDFCLFTTNPDSQLINTKRTFGSNICTLALSKFISIDESKS